jgi:predicted Zn-ribbon and HTH transcriptional regulator
MERSWQCWIDDDGMMFRTRGEVMLTIHKKNVRNHRLTQAEYDLIQKAIKRVVDMTVQNETAAARERIAELEAAYKVDGWHTECSSCGLRYTNDPNQIDPACPRCLDIAQLKATRLEAENTDLKKLVMGWYEHHLLGVDDFDDLLRDTMRIAEGGQND